MVKINLLFSTAMAAIAEYVLFMVLMVMLFVSFSSLILSTRQKA